MELRVRVPGSASNLGPGYDVLGIALGIYNRLAVRTVEGRGVRIDVKGAGAGVLPGDGSNLFYRSAAAAAGRAGASLPGLEVEMVNAIPLVRGLGSSSTAIVAGVVAANVLCGEPFSREQMLDLAAELEGHPDNVSPCLMGGLTISTLTGGHVTCVRTMPHSGLSAVVGVPDYQLETRAMRAALPGEVPHADAVFNVGRASLLTAALLQGNLGALRLAMEDRLHQPYREPLMPGFRRVVEAAVEAGALGACLSGAGPTVLAFVGGESGAVERAMVAAWESEGIDAEAQALPFDVDGATVE